MEHHAADGKAELSGSPVERVLSVFGTARAGALVNLTTDAIRRWKMGTRKGGGGGLVPAKYQTIYIRESGGQLTEADMVAEPRP
jgi:hypothetical protein